MLDNKIKYNLFIFSENCIPAHNRAMQQQCHLWLNTAEGRLLAINLRQKEKEEEEEEENEEDEKTLTPSKLAQQQKCLFQKFRQ